MPVIFLTAHFDKATVRKARLAEPLGYIQKPFMENELRTQIEMVLFKHAAEQRLLENQSRLETFTVATFEGIVEIMSGNIVDCNEQFTHLIGYPRSGLIGTGIDKVLAPEDIDWAMFRQELVRLGGDESDAVSWEQRVSGLNGLTPWKRLTTALYS